MLKVAVVGIGFMGQNHARVYLERNDVELVAVCDTDEKKAKNFASQHKVKFYTNHNDLIKKEKLDAVSIVVPTKYHGRVALDFINSGINILVEKPLASSSREANIIVEKADQKKIVLLVGHIERYNPAVQKIKKMISKNDFGDILSLVVKRVGLYPPRVSDVNVVTDLAVHDLDIAAYLTGKLPNYVMARGGFTLEKGREDHAEIFLDYGKFGCFIQANWLTPLKIRTLSITGTKRYAELNYVTQKVDVYRNEYLVKKLSGYKDFVVKYGNPEKDELKITFEEPLKKEIANFIGCILGKERPIVTGQDGLAAVRLSELITRSIRTGLRVKV